MLDSLCERRGLDGVEEAELLSLPAEILTLSKLQASILWQKSRVNWLKEGDANSKFFHGVISSRRSVKLDRSFINRWENG
jgi:hypothetical protein